MTLTMHCPRCDAVLTAHDEDDLVIKVQAHVRYDHKLAHTLARKHILRRFRALAEESHDPEDDGAH
jgi:hypothetical protein